MTDQCPLYLLTNQYNLLHIHCNQPQLVEVFLNACCHPAAGHLELYS